MVSKKKKEYDICFIGLKQGEHLFEYEINDDFFELFDYQEFRSVCQKVEITLNKKSNLLELSFKNSGEVGVVCDVSNEPFNLKTQGELFLVVKFGEEYNDDNDELLILPNGEHTINVAQYIYEMIVLSVPVRRIHPDVENGTLQSEVLEKLQELSPKNPDENQSNDIDPRWNELKKLLNK